MEEIFKYQAPKGYRMVELKNLVFLMKLVFYCSCPTVRRYNIKFIFTISLSFWVITYLTIPCLKTVLNSAFNGKYTCLFAVISLLWA